MPFLPNHSTFHYINTGIQNIKILLKFKLIRHLALKTFIHHFAKNNMNELMFNDYPAQKADQLLGVTQKSSIFKLTTYFQIYRIK